jgi:hypothetical protein
MATNVDRFHNQYKSPLIAPNERWRKHTARTAKGEPVQLNPAQRESVEAAIYETGALRHLALACDQCADKPRARCCNIGVTPPERPLNALKANATRQLRQEGRWHGQHSPWADKGSKRRLWMGGLLSAPSTML